MKISTKLKRYYRWRYSGPVTIIALFAVGIISWHFMTSGIEFFDKFTCPQIMEYRAGDYSVGGQVRYNDLTDSQKEKYQVIYLECIDMGWMPKK